jgi:UDP-N-acetylmuramoyl-tripeptide--D-alanyl-D-alanine ligase
MKLSGRDLLKIPHREVWNRGAIPSGNIAGVSTDTRTLRAGELFVALRGDRFDGHGYVAAAAARGAVAAVVDTAFTPDPRETLPLIVVDDCTLALGRLARIYRDKFSIPVLAVGGSNGKTTTKEMIASVLATKYSVLSTEANFNNHIGVPQTLFRLTVKHDCAVVETGTNHPGELGRLCEILAPTHALLTNIGREHLEFFGSVDGVADEEGMLLESLRYTRGSVGLVNTDDPRVSTKAKLLKKTVTYGFTHRNAAVRGKALMLDAAGCAGFDFTTPSMTRWMHLTLGVPGEHNAMNALAAIAAGYALRVPASGMRTVLAGFRAPGKRMETVTAGGVVILNDAYNANPDSMIAALRTLAAAQGAGKKIAVLGDMRELGVHAPEGHRAVGREAAALGIDYVLTAGPHARLIAEAAAGTTAIAYDEKNMLAEYLVELVSPGDVVLVKGSRGMTMEDIVEFLLQRLGPTPLSQS